ncbi:MAG TPA: peptidase M48 [Thiomicrorhabdus sp.]|nr:peptidase M48 [Thiomicrorhabdus sp.]
MNTQFLRLKLLKRLSAPFYHFLIGLLVSFHPASFVNAATPPDLGSSDLIEYNIELEQKLGRAFSTALHTQYDLNYDPDVVAYIRKIGHEMASQTGKPRPFRFYVIDNPSINAFAGPNGIIGIHTGLISAAKSEDELAAVIAHEIAHITQNHLSRRHETNTKQSSINTFATLLAAMLIGMYDSSAVYPTLIAGMSLDIEQQLKNSRLHESEADHIGIKFLSQAGYNPHAMGYFFKRLAQESQNNPAQIPEILRSHPVTERRIAESENRAENLPAQQPKKHNNDLLLIQLRLKQTHPDANSSLSDNALTRDEICYKNSLKSANNTFNIQCLQTLVKNNPNHIMYTTQLLHTIVQRELNAPNLIQFANRQASYLMELYPDNTAILMHYANFLLYQNSTKEAIELLTTHTQNQRYTYQAYKKLSEIYAQQKQIAEAYYFLALAQFNIGNLKRTRYLLKQAEKIASTSLKQQISFFKHKNDKLLKDK